MERLIQQDDFGNWSLKGAPRKDIYSGKEITANTEEMLKKKEREFIEMKEKANREEDGDPFGLAYVSTADLKKELRRRKRWK